MELFRRVWRRGRNRWLPGHFNPYNHKSDPQWNDHGHFDERIILQRRNAYRIQLFIYFDINYPRFNAKHHMFLAVLRLRRGAVLFQFVAQRDKHVGGVHLLGKLLRRRGCRLAVLLALERLEHPDDVHYKRGERDRLVWDYRKLQLNRSLDRVCERDRVDDSHKQLENLRLHEQLGLGARPVRVRPGEHLRLREQPRREPKPRMQVLRHLIHFKPLRNKHNLLTGEIIIFIF